MYLLYVDHSGEITNPGETYFVMGGAAVFERQVYHLTKNMNDIGRDLLPELAESTEFHAAAMRNHNKSPWDKLPKDVTEKVMLAVYDCISHAHAPGLCLFGEVIEKSYVVANFTQLLTQQLEIKKEAEQKLKTARGQERVQCKQDRKQAKQSLKQLSFQIIHAAFERLCTHFELFLRGFYDRAHPDEQQRGIFVFDNASYEKDVELLMESFHRRGTPLIDLVNVIERPFFADSRSSRLLQIADFVTYALYRRYENHDSLYFDRIAHRFHESDGVVHGLSHYTSDFRCTCPACLSRRIDRKRRTIVDSVTGEVSRDSDSGSEANASANGDRTQ